MAFYRHAVIERKNSQLCLLFKQGDKGDAFDTFSKPFLYTHTKLIGKPVKCVTHVTLPA